ncbi:MAG: DUF4845 domain-containing protein [Acidobacteria bacterium]|nr:DUF4845 domain-containing protein [Acidobacteriota bacterium]
MRADRSQGGFVSISGIVALVLLASMVFLGLKLLPPYISNYQLQDSIQNIALTASYTAMTEDDILKTVISRAGGYGIELGPRQVSVRKGKGTVIIVAKYTVPVDLLVRQVDLQFEPSASNQNILK